MSKTRIFRIPRVLLMGLMIGASQGMYAADAAENASPISSDDGSVLPILQNSIDSYTSHKETQDLKYNLYLEGKTKVYNGQVEQESNIADPKRSLYIRHSQFFCNQNSEAENLEAGMNCQAPEDLAWADIRISSLLGKTAYTDAKDFLKAEELIRNLVNAFPNKDIRDRVKGNIAEDSKGRRILAESLADQAQLGAAVNSLNYMYAMRIPGANFEDGFKVDDVNKSLLQVLQEESTSRVANPAWRSAVDAAPDVGTVIREQAKMQAFSMYMSYLNYLQQERIELLLSSLIASQADLQTEMKNAQPRPQS